MFFFFFKQKTAYEIGVRLVGSEMCIRDSHGGIRRRFYSARDGICKYHIWTNCKYYSNWRMYALYPLGILFCKKKSGYNLNFKNTGMRRFLILNVIFGLMAGFANSQERLASGRQIPILAWYSIPASETSVSRYQELKDAGITYSFGGFPNIDAMQKALDAAEKVGVKMVVSCPELKSDPEKTVRRFMNHPAVAGYHLQDEPSISQLKGLGEWGRQIQAIDKKHFCYVNLFPNFADSSQLGTKDYLEYVEAYIKEIPIQFISCLLYTSPSPRDG